MPKPGRPSAEQAAAISRSILLAATDLFLAQGFAATSMDAIAARAGVPRSTLYKRFADKRNVLREVISARIAAWGRVNSRKNWMLNERLEERLERYAAWILSWASNPEVDAVVRLASHAWPNPTDVEERLQVLGQSAMVDLIASDIACFGPKGGLHVADPQRVALTLMAMLAGWLSFLPGGQSISEDEAAEAASYLVGILFKGMDGW